MDSKITTIIIVVVAILVGGFLGMFAQSRVDAPQVNQAKVMGETIKSLSSEKVVPSIIAYGQVTKVENLNVTLSNSGQTIVVPVSKQANVYQFVAPAAGSKTPTAPTQKKVAFSEVAKGDSLNITLKIAADGSIEGQSVIILMKGK